MWTPAHEADWGAGASQAHPADIAGRASNSHVVLQQSCFQVSNRSARERHFERSLTRLASQATVVRSPHWPTWEICTRRLTIAGNPSAETPETPILRLCPWLDRQPFPRTVRFGSRGGPTTSRAPKAQKVTSLRAARAGAFTALYSNEMPE